METLYLLLRLVPPYQILYNQPAGLTYCRPQQQRQADCHGKNLAKDKSLATDDKHMYSQIFCDGYAHLQAGQQSW